MHMRMVVLPSLSVMSTKRLSSRSFGARQTATHAHINEHTNTHVASCADVGVVCAKVQRLRSTNPLELDFERNIEFQNCRQHVLYCCRFGNNVLLCVCTAAVGFEWKSNAMHGFRTLNSCFGKWTTTLGWIRSSESRRDRKSRFWHAAKACKTLSLSVLHMLLSVLYSILVSCK